MRFPEFEDADHCYKKYSFKDIFLFSTGKSIKQSEASPEFEMPCVRYGELYHMYGEVITEVFNKTNLDKSELLFSDGDEILLPSAGEDPLDIGSASALTVRNVAIGRTINILKPIKANIYYPAYVSYYINQKLKRVISSLAKGVSISNVYNSDLRTLEITLPSISEQQKIASFLSLIDERIQTQNKIIGELQTLIKEVCKRHYHDVEKKDYLISELGEPFSTMNLSKADLSDHGNKCILYGELFTVYDCVIDEIKSFTKRIAPKASLSQENDLLFPSSTTVNALSLISPSAITQKGVTLGGDMFGIRLYNEFSNEYLSYIINYIYRDSLAKFAKGSTIIHLHYSDIKNFTIRLPKLEQQKALTSLLRSMKSKISLEQENLTLLKKIKQHFLRNIFI